MFTFSACSLIETSAPISIESIEKTGTEGLVDTYTITYTDGTSTTFTITNGEDGQDGVNGIDGTDGQDGENGVDGTDGINAVAVSVTGIEKTSTEGLVDTYTITYSNGTTSTFTVTNGSNGADGTDGINGIDGEDASIEDIYNAEINSGEFSGTFLEFVQNYLSVSEDDSVAVSKAILSAVSIYCNFTNPDQSYQTAGAGVIYQLKEAVFQ